MSGHKSESIGDPRSYFSLFNYFCAQYLKSICVKKITSVSGEKDSGF